MNDVPPNLQAWFNDARAKEVRANEPQAESKAETILARETIAEIDPEKINWNWPAYPAWLFEKKVVSGFFCAMRGE